MKNENEKEANTQGRHPDPKQPPANPRTRFHLGRRERVDDSLAHSEPRHAHRHARHLQQPRQKVHVVVVVAVGVVARVGDHPVPP